MARARRYDDDPPRRRRDDDDEDDYDYEPPPRREPAPSQAPKILLILGGVFVAVALICCGAGLYIYTTAAKGFQQMQQDMQRDLQKNMTKMREEQAKKQAEEGNAPKAKATDAVNAFLAEVRGDRLDAAYAMTSADYRARIDRDEFAAVVAANVETLNGGFPTVDASILDPDEAATFRFEKRAAFGVVNLTAIREGGKWVVDRFSGGGK